MQIQRDVSRLAKGAAVVTSLALGLAAADQAEAALVTFKSYSGNVALSTDGWGGTRGSGVISASALNGSKVLAAYLYTATQNTNTVPTAVTLDGTSVAYTSTSGNATACCTLKSHRVDVTSIVAPVIDGGSGGVYDFAIDEGSNNASIDGHALAGC